MFRSFLSKHGQNCLNLFLFIFFMDMVVHRLHGELCKTHVEWHRWFSVYASADWQHANWASMHFVEWAFLIHNLIMCTLLLSRSKHLSIDKNWAHQSVAFLAFFLCGFMMGTPKLNNPTVSWIAMIIVSVALLIGIISLLNLGRSFGILIARRRIKEGGLYSIVRHPMYCSDILLRLGFMISHFSLYVICLGVFSIACYFIRAILEEKFLCEDIAYRNYMNQVRYRFIPYIY